MPSFAPVGQVVALLGPTNTGKTHRAIERMLSHRSGMIGLPLRLLAREVYDRITAEKGEQAVALVTGEERRVPPNPRWWICTVEAMPDKAVDFLAVDEIQLAGDRARGHVFTERLLGARGNRETMFLGSETIAPLLERLVPAATIERHPRFSKLSHLGWRKLGQLPKRTAIVAFSANDVYALAERVRRAHGGTAVVLGALSPRTRNAQVAMYQAGEVDYMVATDAIGMGLNMDIAHVAFARLGKFDGRESRGLSAAEVAQIAGRAGRWRRDGTFGPTDDLPGIDPEIVTAVESHTFPPLRRLWWRSAALDTSSVDALRAGLLRPPPHAVLQHARDEEDARALESLLRMPEVRDLATTPERVALLWEVCRVPDFRKTLDEAHAGLLARVYLHLARSGRLPHPWIAHQIDALDRPDGDIDRLSARLAHVRTWTYLTHRAGWVEDAAVWQQRAREVEDRLSDALHVALSERFVDRRGMALASAPAGRLAEDGVVRVGGFEVGVLRGLAWKPAKVGDRAGDRAAARALSDEVATRVDRLVDAPYGAFAVDEEGHVTWEGGPVGRLVAGGSVADPGFRVARNDLLGPAALERVTRRVVAFVRDWVAEVLAPLRAEEVPRGPAQGLLFELEQGLGCAEARRADLFDPEERRLFARMGVRFGWFWCWSQPMLERADARAVLWTVWRGPERDEAFYAAIGTPRVGGVPVRVDHLEEVAAKARRAARGGAAFDPPEGPPGVAVGALLAGLGYRSVGDRWALSGRR